MVILGHILTNCVIEGHNTWLCMFLYAVHIPLFLSISAMFVKDTKMDMAFGKNILKRFVVPYCIWEFILTIFYTGFSGFRTGGVISVFLDYLNNLINGLWFIRAFLFTYILWLLLQCLPKLWRMIVGTLLLLIVNIATMRFGKSFEIFSLTLYTYTLYSVAACLKPYFIVFSWKKVLITSLAFLCAILMMKPEYDYFQLSFTVIVNKNLWWVFIVRLIAGLSFSMLLINLASVICWGGHVLLQEIGQRTLQIYMLQALLVEGVLPRFLHLQQTLIEFLGAIVIAILMTFLCNYIIYWTSKFKLCRLLLWGTSFNR